ncbi:hypothetical protein HER32_06665 [Hymenobacter sp. BT18]|uniref:hypothetical protein n=1 Tax=Hymenobacter sp. BT18 TaxID=2835648 RepID=UPI00143EE87B|nr:hypothetical protein [Hymenobacter sp. BT18]QIX60875.1 hypothetical protein HER32_06665 [Hymenobacter sp. BT18]
MSQIVFTSAGNLAYSPGSGNFYRLNGAMGASTGAGGGKPGQQDGVASTTPTTKYSAQDVAPWGDDNLFPQNVLKEISKSTIIAPVLDWKQRAIYGQGIVYGRVTGYDKNGQEVFERVRVPEIETFFRKSNIPRYGFEGLQNLVYWANGFAEVILSRDRSRITSVNTQDAVYCRYSVPKPGKGPEKMHISAMWAEGAKPGDAYTTSVPVLDPYTDPVEALRARTDGFKYIYPLSVPSPGQSLYQLVAWNSLRKSGWLDVALAIPEFKKNLLANQLTIKYLIEADIRYWSWKYPDWDQKKEGDRKQIISEELAAFEATMAGTSGAGKSIMTVTMPDPANPGSMISVFKVTAIDDKIKSGLLVEDSQEASSHHYTALQVDPTLPGISPGKGMGAGSGSDKRVAFNVFVATHYFLQHLILEPLYLVRDYNGWGEDIEFRFLNMQVGTLDQSSEVAPPAQQPAEAPTA